MRVMKFKTLRRALILALALVSLQPDLAQAAPRSHREVVSSVADMVANARARRLARQKGLQILNVMWEDTGRYLGSSVGPNISDVTIEVEIEDANSEKQRRLMPVIRFPNFSDKTGDIDINEFFVRVGNQKEGASETTVSLRELLEHPLRYMSGPKKGTIKGDTLLAKRDEKVLVSAQSAFLPIREGGSTRFWPVIFNYQSYAKNPAVLTILVTRQGTSMTIIDNDRDTVSAGGSFGQRLYFNKAGQRAPLTAERLKDVQSSGVTMNGENAADLGDDSNLLMMIQVPLKVKRQGRGLATGFIAGGGIGYGYGKSGAAPSAMSPDLAESARSDIDLAVLGHGPAEGPYTELDDLSIERDPRFPVRVTVQFYQATSNGVVSEEDMQRMASQIDKVYKKADYVGSLVIPEGEPRPTMWDGAMTAPQHLSWRNFAGLRERYQKYGWVGVVYRDDMVTGVYAEPPHIGAVPSNPGLRGRSRSRVSAMVKAKIHAAVARSGRLP